ncbi:hypothetical protein BS17DRAFT_768758 [Gyrodon lividus]|nr:hypothetical protein BS17DRAFT_768758 [Gyrodon lividus]
MNSDDDNKEEDDDDKENVSKKTPPTSKKCKAKSSVSKKEHGPTAESLAQFSLCLPTPAIIPTTSESLALQSSPSLPFPVMVPSNPPAYCRAPSPVPTLSPMPSPRVTTSTVLLPSSEPTANAADSKKDPPVITVAKPVKQPMPDPFGTIRTILSTNTLKIKTILPVPPAHQEPPESKAVNKEEVRGPDVEASGNKEKDGATTLMLVGQATNSTKTKVKIHLNKNTTG